MEESIYGNHRGEMENVMNIILGSIDELREDMIKEFGSDPVEHCLSRIKDEDSMREKCRRQNLPETTESALEQIHDAIGIRVVCAFISDVYSVRDHLRTLDKVEVIEEKDYIKQAKPNGYRSLHMILRYDNKYYVEIQLRTISMDTWAALEHHMRYKKKVSKSDALISAELKRCADELASTDMSMQTIRDLIRSESIDE
ncbi:ppGpp synthetase catalytic domain-containing protein (RelA/SpoT-type nucleotidyltranferase) [Pseudobutyrivibrio ruminis]|uniref:PpGpp synthetase catalytic domain-containing protein (RelA/SpoT-type nucleotidyltranferase) n=1 Tax=Pseudobutyrivibrio ruminis TaxID=46206 RepID=A0A1H7IZQ2_9FIRM|nr:GTP pyrophosphokinase family protein [Pseudobutyrivibrio ruminis]SEK67674.1 ppGpp synthetase catalytic domain-containing protein (RelA/SpoT-type nucleotidyltranferase) [Pseudobutyrivibrio ruminis]